MPDRTNNRLHTRPYPDKTLPTCYPNHRRNIKTSLLQNPGI